MAEPLKVGDRVWLHAERWRGGQPEDDFRAYTIIGETRQSWVAEAANIGSVEKVSKLTMQTAQGNRSPLQWYSDAGREDWIWLRRHHTRIHDAVMRCQDVDTLKRIDALLKGETP